MPFHKVAQKSTPGQVERQRSEEEVVRFKRLFSPARQVNNGGVGCIIILYYLVVSLFHAAKKLLFFCKLQTTI